MNKSIINLCLCYYGTVTLEHLLDTIEEVYYNNYLTYDYTID